MEASPGSRGGLSRQASRGFVWLFANTAGSQAVQFVGQIILAYLLSPEDFGLIALAFTVTMLVSVIERAGISEILVQRQSEFDRWVTPAFWLALALGGLSAAVMVVVAPLAAAMYGEPRLIGMILLLALASPFAALQNITRAVFLRDLRFRMLALGGVGQSIAQTVLTIVFAALGFGVYSFVLPRPITAAGGLAIQWWIARPRVRGRARAGECRLLFADSARMLVANLVMTLNAQGDYILLGVLQPAAVVGLYYFAFRMSTQVITLFSGNVTGVLFPTLSKLRNDPAAQTRAYFASARMLAVIGAPIALLQAAIADPVVKLLFDPKWYAAIPFLQILSIGMVFRIAGSSAAGLLQAQGRFHLRMKLSFFYLGLFFPIALAGYWLGGARGLAGGIAGYYVTTGLLHPRIVTHSTGGTWADIWNVFAVPVTAALSAIAVSLGIARILVSPANSFATLGILVPGTVILYVGGLKLFAPALLSVITFHLRDLLSTKRRFAGT